MAKVYHDTNILQPITLIMCPHPELNAVKRMNLVRLAETVPTEGMPAEAIETAPKAFARFAIPTDGLIGQTIVLEDLDQDVTLLAEEFLQICVLILKEMVNEGWIC